MVNARLVASSVTWRERFTLEPRRAGDELLSGGELGRGGERVEAEAGERRVVKSRCEQAQYDC